jgi:hypothetical protein
MPSNQPKIAIGRPLHHARSPGQYAIDGEENAPRPPPNPYKSRRVSLENDRRDSSSLSLRSNALELPNIEINTATACSGAVLTANTNKDGAPETHTSQHSHRRVSIENSTSVASRVAPPAAQNPESTRY